MLTIHKYQLDSNDTVEVAMPQHAHILTAQVQHGVPCLWAVVDTEHAMITRRFRIFGTGSAMDKDYTRFIGTFQLYDGDLVYHVFEESYTLIKKVTPQMPHTQKPHYSV